MGGGVRVSKPKCTSEVIERAVRLKSHGALDKDIAAACGVAAQTFSTWVNHPKSKRQAELAEALKRCEAEYYAQLEGIILRAAEETDWKAAAWLLERKRPAQYAKRTGFVDADGAPKAPTLVLGVEPKPKPRGKR